MSGLALWRTCAILSIDLDASKWARYQGLADERGKAGAADIRADIRSHVLNLVQGSTFLEEADAEVRIA